MDVLAEKAWTKKDKEENRSDKANQKSFSPPQKQPRSRGKDIHKLKSTKKRKDEEISPSPHPFFKRPRILMPMDNSFQSNVDSNKVECFIPGDQCKKRKK